MATQSVCSRCARSGKTCCQETDIFLTVNDIQRIAGYTSRIDFYEYRQPADPSYLDQDDDPIWGAQTIRSDGTRRVLRHKEGQDCLFLGEKGCELSMAVRPLVCRLHPYTYDAGGLAGVLDPRCLLAHQEQGGDLIASPRSPLSAGPPGTGGRPDRVHGNDPCPGPGLASPIIYGNFYPRGNEQQ